MISGDHQLEEPKQFFGGIIADPMGFGKTLIMIALVAASAQGHNGENLRLQGSSNDVENNNPTLIVVPPPCMFSFMPFFVRFTFNDGVSVGYLGGTAFTVRSMISECSSKFIECALNKLGMLYQGDLHGPDTMARSGYWTFSDLKNSI